MAKKQNAVGILPGESLDGASVAVEPEIEPQPPLAGNGRTLGDSVREDRFYSLAQFTDATGLPSSVLVKAFRTNDPSKSGSWVFREGPKGDEVSGKSILDWFDKSGMLHQPSHSADLSPDPVNVRRVPEREHRPVDKVLIEVPLCDQPIVEGFKNSEGQAKHVSFNVKSQRQNENLRRLFSGLEEVGATVDGRKVASLADACRWLLEHLSD